MSFLLPDHADPCKPSPVLRSLFGSTIEKCMVPGYGAFAWFPACSTTLVLICDHPRLFCHPPFFRSLVELKFTFFPSSLMADVPAL